MAPSTPRPTSARAGVPPAPLVLGLALVFGGCEGAILQSPEGGAPGDADGDGLPDGVDVPAVASRFARLTHAQYDRSVGDLFRADDTPRFSAGFRADPSLTGFLFADDGGRFEVDQVLWGAYQRAAEDAAAWVTATPARLERILPPPGGDEAARVRAFVETFGQRAFRRPLAPAEVTAYAALHQAGRTRYAGVPAFEAGVRLVIEGLLQSPHFVYRVESSDRVVDGVVPLGDFEVATRLSYALWGTTPDDTLLARAAAGELRRPEVVAEEARRLLDDPRAADATAAFHAQLLDVGRYATIAPARSAFPDAPADLGALAATETDLFVRATFEEGGSFVDVLTSTETFVNADLARIYGLEGTYGEAFERVTLDPTRRRGLFTQVGFLAVNATSFDPDPIHRGVFLTKRIACNPLGFPPGEIPPLPAAMGRTNRETVEDHTEQEGSDCAQCHAAAINPFGFPFENYDAVGAWRDEDNGFPVDPTAAPLLGGARVPVATAVELAETMAAHPEVHRCYVEHWLEHLYGRPAVRGDRTLVGRVAERSLEGASLRDLIVELVTSRAFLSRGVEVQR